MKFFCRRREIHSSPSARLKHFFYFLGKMIDFLVIFIFGLLSEVAAQDFDCNCAASVVYCGALADLVIAEARASCFKNASVTWAGHYCSESLGEVKYTFCYFDSKNGQF